MKNKLRLILNWIIYLTTFIWMPILFIIVEISLIPRMLRTKKEDRCHS